MRIAIMGAGAVGGFFGARLANAGHEVYFVDRDTQFEALINEGLKVYSPLGNIRLHPIQATNDPDQVGPVELVLFGVKLWDMEVAARSCLPLLGPETIIIPIQNGTEAVRILARTLGGRRVLGGVAYIAVDLERPGVVRHTGNLARLRFGEADGGLSERVRCLAEDLKGCGFETAAAENIAADVWEKFVFLVPFSGMTALMRQPIGAVLGNANSRAVYRRAMEETVRAGLANGVALPDEIVERLMGFADNLPPEMHASMANDLEYGRRLEVPWLSGAVVRYGLEHDLDTPINATILAGLQPFVDGNGL